MLAIALHHIAADGWSLGVIDRELEHFYTAFDRGLARRPAAVAAAVFRLLRMAARRLSGKVLEGQLDYWRRQLRA